MIIDILSEVVLNQMAERKVLDYTSDIVINASNLSYKSVIEKYTLDFKQAVAFEIMASSFILKSLMVGNVPDDALQSFLKEIMKKGSDMQNHCQG